MTGVASMLTRSQEAGQSDPSYTMAGPQVTLREGGIVPIAYGECVVGGTMISGQLIIENDVTSGPVDQPTTVLPFLGT